MTPRELDKIIKKLGSEGILINLLRQICFGYPERRSSQSLAKIIVQRSPLQPFFCCPQEKGSPFQDGPYLKLHQLSRKNLILDYGECYGGDAEEGSQYEFNRVQDYWTLNPNQQLVWLH